MDAVAVPPTAPANDDLGESFIVHTIRRDGDRLLYFGEAQVPREQLVGSTWRTFREAGYEVSLHRSGADGDGFCVLVAEPIELGLDGIPWTNLILFVATIASTLYVGALWYHIDLRGNPLAIVEAWPFAAGVIAVLGFHELGHYLLSRHHGVRASLPYFLPVPTIFGTMGAVITIKGRIPDRRALFDIGVAGPLVGLVATVVVTVIGLHMPPVTAPTSVVESETAVELAIGYPPLLEFLAWVVDQPLRFDDPARSVNPVVIAGWLGMFITFLNLLPVGQLDGGHITRSMLGDVQARIGLIVPVVLFALGLGLYGLLNVPLHAIVVWLVWGVFGLLLAVVGPADPIDDAPLDTRRQLIGAITFVLGVACFVPIPIEIVS